MSHTINIKRALISVSDKTDLIPLATALHEAGVELISTGGSAKALAGAGLPVTPVADITEFPEIMGGRVKTLHPRIHGGILGRRDVDAEVALTHNINWIDLVVCNLYPFAQTIRKPDVTHNEAIENIDIGGPSMLRAAAKNHAWVSVLCDPSDYAAFIKHISAGIDLTMRARLAAKAFAHTAQYDAMIAGYLERDPFPQQLTLTFEKQATLRYGENPNQDACVYQSIISQPTDLLAAKQLQGKALSYNNLLDSQSAFSLVNCFDAPSCVVVKHMNPCGVASGEDISSAFSAAYAADPMSAFGGIIALNRPLTAAIAAELADKFVEVIIAPGYDAEALTQLGSKINLRLLELPCQQHDEASIQYRSISGGLLAQTEQPAAFDQSDWRVVSRAPISTAERQDLDFAWHVVRAAKSNAIVIVKDRTTLGIGAGHVSRVDAVIQACTKAGEAAQGAVVASDAFFPFRDNIDVLSEYGIKAIIQPRGSKRDEEVIAACDEHGIGLLMTDVRCFNH